MIKLIEKLKGKGKALIGVVGAAMTTGILTVAASAEEPAVTQSVSDQVIKQFTGAAADVTPIILGVMGAGLSIFVIFVGIKLGKKMFSTVSKG